MTDHKWLFVVRFARLAGWDGLRSVSLLRGLGLSGRVQLPPLFALLVLRGRIGIADRTGVLVLLSASFRIELAQLGSFFVR
jgi:hypothetical protein